ncbi:MAG: PLP-dependent aspartate aminotransferase family protein [Pseudomonadota bacterium]
MAGHSVETVLARALSDLGEFEGASKRPLCFATTHIRQADGSFAADRIYGRSDNPTLAATEQVLATAEAGAGALLFSSGMAAISSALATLGPGSHVLAPRSLYYGVESWLERYGASHGLTYEYVDQTDLGAVAAAFRPDVGNVIWMETPGNPLLDIADIKSMCALAEERHARVIVDSSVATPLLTQPLNLGADLVVHSATKYLGGHSDLLGGVVVARELDETWDKLQHFRYSHGNQLDAFDAWLLARSLESLGPRMRQICESGAKIAEWLNQDSRVDRVYYPGLPSHPNHAIARDQMGGRYPGLMSFTLYSGEERAIAATNQLALIKRATSFGGAQSTIEHHPSIRDLYAARSTVPRSLLRLSVGLENPSELINDLDQAL